MFVETGDPEPVEQKDLKTAKAEGDFQIKTAEEGRGNPIFGEKKKDGKELLSLGQEGKVE